MENKAVYMTGIRQFEIKEIDMPNVRDHEVLIKMEYIGICGSDVHYYEHGRIGDFVAKPPFILGHESSGIVEKVGSGVNGLKVGDRVAIEPGVPCGHCKYCKEGKYNLCPSVVFLAAPPDDGSMRKYMAYPEDMCFKLPETVTTLEGALIEPLAVGLHAAKQGGVAMGNTVVVLGAGTIGLVSLLASKALSASKIIVTDVIEKRLSYATKLGATAVINAKEEDVLNIVNQLTDGQGADVVIETAGSEITIHQSAYLVGRGGTIVAVGLPMKDSVGFDFVTLINKEAEIKTVFRYRNLYPLAIDAVEKGKIAVKDIVTHEFDFDESQKAYDFVVDHKEDVLKAVIKIQQ